MKKNLIHLVGLIISLIILTSFVSATIRINEVCPDCMAKYNKGRPPLGFRVGSGSSGFNSFHLSSFMNRVYFAIGHLSTL